MNRAAHDCRYNAATRPAGIPLACALIGLAPRNRRGTLLLIALSAELRHLGWTCLAALLGAALAYRARAVTDSSAAYRPAP